MKALIPNIAIMLLIVMAGCRHATEPSGSDMHVNLEIESAFQNDDVVLTLDDRTLLHARITTNYTISLAWASGLQTLSREPHILSVTLPDYNVRKEYTIGVAADTSTVLVRFDKTTKRIDIEQVKGMLLRD